MFEEVKAASTKCNFCGKYFHGSDVDDVCTQLRAHHFISCDAYHALKGKKEYSYEAGKKDDSGKPHMNLLLQEIPTALEEVSRCLRLGEQKYGRGNWRRVENKEDRYLAALLRHLTAYHKGEKKDPESGRSHLAHVAVNALFLLDGESE